MNEIIGKQYDIYMCAKCKHRVKYENAECDTVLLCSLGVENNSNGCGFKKAGLGYGSLDEYHKYFEEEVCSAKEKIETNKLSCECKIRNHVKAMKREQQIRNYYTRQMRLLAGNQNLFDAETLRIKANNILIEALNALGCDMLVKRYNQIEKDLGDDDA